MRTVSSGSSFDCLTSSAVAEKYIASKSKLMTERVCDGALTSHEFVPRLINLFGRRLGVWHMPVRIRLDGIELDLVVCGS
jgi:hypothetical protein